MTWSFEADLSRVSVLSLPPFAVACKVNETDLMDTMDLFVSLGLRDAGYTTVSGMGASTVVLCNRVAQNGHPLSQSMTAGPRAVTSMALSSPIQ